MSNTPACEATPAFPETSRMAHDTVNLTTGSPTFGTPEAALGSFAAAQLARRIGLPPRCGGAFTSSKLPDAQTMQESVTSLSTAIL